MSDSSSPRRLYLVRHGEAKPKSEDPERGLTDAGRAEVTRMAAWAAGVGVHVDEILHSGKLRAQQTADVFAARLNARALSTTGLAPNDDVGQIARLIAHERSAVMLVGHLPFLERLVALLTTADVERGVLKLDAGAVVELTIADDGWSVTGLMQPRILPEP